MFFRKISSVWIIISACIALGFTTPYASASEPAQTVSKMDGRYQASITAYYPATVATNGFLSSITLGTQWWELIGQPVEIYTFTWEPGGKYMFADGRTLHSYNLSKHPDLLRRFEALRPANITVSFKVDFSYPDNGFDSNFDYMKKFQPNNFSKFGGQSGAARRVKSHFLIGPAGEATQDLSPGSPRDWQSFLDWELPGKGDRNRAAQNTFRASTTATFSGLRVESITLPEARLTNIIDELDRRENKDEADEEEGDAEDKKSGLWDKRPELRADSLETKRGMWDKRLTASANTGTTSGGLWSSRETLQKNEPFEIKKNAQGHNGVESQSGRVLIPYRNWDVESFENGIAKVMAREDPNIEKRGYCGQTLFTVIDWWAVGYVDVSGKWVMPPKRAFKVRWHQDTSKVDDCWTRGGYLMTGLTCRRYDPAGYARYRERFIKDQNACNAFNEDLARDLISEGHQHIKATK